MLNAALIRLKLTFGEFAVAPPDIIENRPARSRNVPNRFHL
jgi:hypothetical protein